MNRFVQDGAERLRLAYGGEAEARIDAGIQVLNRRYHRQMASAPLAVRVRLWLRLAPARRHLRRTVEAAYFGRGRLYLARMPWQPAGRAPARDGDAPVAERGVGELAAPTRLDVLAPRPPARRPDTVNAPDADRGSA